MVLFWLQHLCSGPRFTYYLHSMRNTGKSDNYRTGSGVLMRPDQEFWWDQIRSSDETRSGVLVCLHDWIRPPGPVGSSGSWLTEDEQVNREAQLQRLQRCSSLLFTSNNGLIVSRWGCLSEARLWSVWLTAAPWGKPGIWPHCIAAAERHWSLPRTFIQNKIYSSLLTKRGANKQRGDLLRAGIYFDNKLIFFHRV